MFTSEQYEEPDLKSKILTGNFPRNYENKNVKNPGSEELDEKVGVYGKFSRFKTFETNCSKNQNYFLGKMTCFLSTPSGILSDYKAVIAGGSDLDLETP